MATRTEKIVTEAISDTFLAAERLRLEGKTENRNVIFPEYFSGARCVLLVNGKRIGAAMNVSWNVSVEHEEIRTIDSQLPWELVPGQISIGATLSRIISPDRTLASDNLFTAITAALHTPYASLEVRDRLGLLIFYAKGSFTDMQGQVSNGALGVETVKFKGYYWKQNDKQEFDPQDANLSPSERYQKKLGSLITGNSLAGKITSLGG